jgi:tetratricopeptide (TPR) repeat protein
VVGLWFAIVRVVGAPEAATRLLLVTLAAAAALSATLPRPRLLGHPRYRALAGTVAATSPILLELGGGVVGRLPLGGALAEVLLAILWGALLLPALWALPRRPAGPSRDLARAAATMASVLAALAGLVVLASGVPVWMVTAVAAACLFVPAGGSGEGEPAGGGLDSLLSAAVATAWLLAVPPLLLAFAGAVPQGIACMVLSFMVGLSAGRLLLPPSMRTVWIGSLLVTLSGLLALTALSAHALVAQLALGATGLLSPWIVLALAVCGTAGLAAATTRPNQSRPGFLAAGVAVGMAVVATSLLGAPPDLPVRASAGLACLAAMIGLTVLKSPSTWAHRVAWIACVIGVAGVGMLPSMQLHTAVLGTASRVPARDLGLIEEILESEALNSTPGRAGPRGVVRSSRGEYLLRAYDVWTPGEAERSTETLHSLLPVLAAGHPRHAAVIGLGRGDVLDPLGAANLDRLFVLDRSPGAAAQIATLGGAPRDVITSPACQLVRSHPLPSLPLPRGALDVVVVDLPQPSLPGARAWFGPGFAARIAASLTEDGWTSFRVHSAFMDAEDLARVVASFSSVFPDATVWVGPGGADVILLGSPGGGLPDAQRMIHGLTRRALRQSLRVGEIQAPADLFCRAFGRADSEVFHELSRSDRGLEWRSGTAQLRAETHVPLARLAAAALPLDAVVDLNGVPAGELSDLQAASASAGSFWPVYLEFLDVLAQGDGAASMDQVERVRQGSHDPTRDLVPLVRQIVEGGRAAAARGQDEDAHSMFLLAAAFSPEDPEVNVELGRQAWGNGNVREAIDRFELALARDPDNLVALLGAADSHIRLGEANEALALLERAATSHPDSADALYNLGRLYVDLNRTDEGLEQYRRALPVQPDNARIHFGIAEAHFRRAVGLRDEGRTPHEELRLAREAGDRSLVLERDPISLCLVGQIELVSGNFAAAEKTLRESVELAPDNFESRAALGESFFAQHEYEAARRQFQEAARIRPADETVHHRLEQLDRIGVDGS